MIKLDERFYRPSKDQLEKVKPYKPNPAGIKEEPNEIKSLQEKINKQSDEISKLEIMIIELSKKVNNLENKFTPFK